MKIMNPNLKISPVGNMMLLVGLHVATFWVGNAVLERGTRLTMLLGCPHGWCQWAGMETSKQTPWCTSVLHSHAPQFCVHSRSEVPQRGSGLLCWGQTTPCAGIKLYMHPWTPIKVSLYIHAHKTAWEPQNGCPWNFTLESFTAICSHIPALVNVEQKQLPFCIKTHVNFLHILSVLTFQMLIGTKNAVDNNDSWCPRFFFH